MPQSFSADSSNRLRIVTVTADEPHHRYLTALLASKFTVLGAIVEPCSRRRRLLLRQRRIRSWAWFYYHYLRRTITGLDRFRQDYFGKKLQRLFENEEARRAYAAVPQITVESVNDRAGVEAVARWRPEVVVLCGTSILRAEMLAACGSVIVNVHGGFLPNYRGNHCFFFAMYEGETKFVGSTIHHVDHRIDLGDIIQTVQDELLPSDTPETQYCKCDAKAFEVLVEHLANHANGIRLPRTEQLEDEGKEYRMRDRTPWVELKWLLRRYTRARK